MKLLYTTLALFCFSIVGLSQSYIPLLNENNYWDVATYSQGHICDFSDSAVPERYFISGEVVLNNKTYKAFSSYKFYPKEGSQPVCPPFIVDTIAVATGVYLREDVNQQRVYRYDTQENNEYVLFDFSVSIGDTVYLNQLDQERIIAAIDTLQTNDGIKRRRFSYTTSSSPEEGYVEGIGGPQGFFIDPIPFFENGYFVMCVKSKDDEVILSNRGCYSFTTINSLSSSKNYLKIYPNLVDDVVTIDSPTNQDMVVYNLVGNSVFTQKLVKGKNTIDLTHLKPQFYLIKAVDDIGDMVVKKIMKL
jgi:hypothetical protein